MSDRPWKERFSEHSTCVRCLEQADVTDLDRLFWCRKCRALAVQRAKRVGWKVGAVTAILLALWIWLMVQPSTLILGGWMATVLAAFWLTARITREVHFGVARYRNQRATEATPPLDPPGSDPDADADVGPNHRWGVEAEAERMPWEDDGN